MAVALSSNLFMFYVLCKFTISPSHRRKQPNKTGNVVRICQLDNGRGTSRNASCRRSFKVELESVSEIIDLKKNFRRLSAFCMLHALE